MHIERLDPNDTGHASALVALLDEYARGDTGTGEGLAPRAMAELPGRLARCAHYVGWLAFEDGRAIGVVNCFEGLSTFRARPLLNIHDIAVTPAWQRRGIGTALLEAVVAEAGRRGCCKITLEVLQGNTGAIAAYRKAGFAPYELDPAMGSAMFFEKPLPVGE
jgi:ribosomal protein S18 acetylase RimI-like enzyme